MEENDDYREISLPLYDLLVIVMCLITITTSASDVIEADFRFTLSWIWFFFGVFVLYLTVSDLGDKIDDEDLENFE